MSSRSWFLRPIAWFITASIATTILHELAHASAAFALGVRSTLYSYFANLDLTPAQAATSAPALIRIAGPAFSLVVGLLSWLAFRRTRLAESRLPLLYLSVFGVGTFCGNLMSAAFVGDFSRVAEAWHLSMTARYAIAAAGGLSVAAIHFRAGRELIQGVPAHVGRVLGTLGVIVLPVVAGTAAIVLLNQPMPAAFASARAGEAVFWLLAVVGALATTRRSQNTLGSLELHWADGTAVIIAILVVRLLVRGIPFMP